MDRVKTFLFFVPLLAAGGVFAQAPAAAQPVNTFSGASLPDASASVARVGGAFVVVVAVFLGGVWFFRNWQRLSVAKGGGAKLSLIEMKSLGQRQTLYVVGYQQQRMLLASSPAGVTLVSHLPEALEGEQPAAPAGVSFSQALQNVLTGKK